MAYVKRKANWNYVNRQRHYERTNDVSFPLNEECRTYERTFPGGPGTQAKERTNVKKR